VWKCLAMALWIMQSAAAECAHTHLSPSLSLYLIYALSVSYALGRSLGPYAEDERLERRGQLLPLGGRGIGADQRLTSLTNDRIG
jgi:hypothetical protein